MASPDNPAALAALAQLHLKENDFASYYMARLREARALKGRPGAVEALLDAGRVAREQLRSPTRRAPASRRRSSRSPRTATRCGHCRRCSPARRGGTKRVACWNASWR